MLFEQKGSQCCDHADGRFILRFYFINLEDKEALVRICDLLFFIRPDNGSNQWHDFHAVANGQWAAQVDP